MAIAKIDEFKKLQFFKFCKTHNFDFRVFDIFGVGANSIVFAEAVQSTNNNTSFKLIRAIDVSEFVVNFNLGSAEKNINDYIKATTDFLFDYRYDNFSYKEVILK